MDTPVADAFVANNMEWAAQIVSAGAIFGTCGSAFTCMVGQNRIFYNMARDVMKIFVFSSENYRDCFLRYLAMCLQ